MKREVFQFSLGAFALGAAGMYAASRKVAASVRRQRWIKFATYFIVMNTVLILAGLGPAVFILFVLSLLLIGAYEIHAILAAGLPSTLPFRLVIWAAYVALGTGLILFWRLAAPEPVMFVYLIVAIFGGFSQVFGQLLGKHRLAESISPTKTIEGAVGGALAGAACSAILRQLVQVNLGRALAISAVIMIAALAGDLAASWLKRRRGVKDFGHLLPGHGGVLDRFDSFLFAAPASLIMLNRHG